MKKLFTFALIAVLSVGLILPTSASAQTSIEVQLKQIADLTAQIKALQDQINGLQKQQVTLQQTANQTAFEIATGLRQGNEGESVKLLQTLLAVDTSIYPEGMITGYFGPATRRAIERYQRQNGLEAVGFIGPKTRSLLEKLFKTHFAEAQEIEEDIEDEVEDAVKAYLASLPVVPDASCAIPTNPYAGGSPFIQKDGKLKIISNGNTLIYRDGKHKIIITPNSYIEKNGKKQLLITPGYRIEKDGKNKSFIKCGNGTTTPPFPGGDTTAPVLSSIVATPSYQGAVVTWTTNEPASSKLYYGTQNPLNLNVAPSLSSGSLKTSHSLNVTGLAATTTYYYVIESKDAKGNKVLSSQQSFVTSSALDATAPSISAIGISAGTSTATITWTTNESSRSKIYYGTTTPLNIAAALTKVDSALVTSHTLLVTGLTPSTTHYFKVESVDAAGNTATSSETSFATSAVPPVDTTAPTLSAINASAQSTTATISWNTSESATTKIYYSTTTPLATSTALSVADANLLTGHSKQLTSLVPSTTYYFRVESVDAAGNVALSSETSFVTSAPVDTTAPVISAIGASNVASTTASINWTTNESATSKVYYGTATPLATSTASVASSAAFVTGHTLGLSGLSTSTTYYVVVESKDSANNTASGSEFSFTTAL